ncbi:MAG: helix-turn-helix domain-containing protein [Actinoallomurus sp.]
MSEPVGDFFRGIGRSVAREGRGLDTLQTAIRVAGLAVWRRISADAEPLRLSAQLLCVLGETVMLIQDEVAAAAAEGYAQAEAAAVGPTVWLSEVSRSMRWARQGLDLVRRGLIADDTVVRCAEHMSTLILFQDEGLLAALSARQLAPLAHLRQSQQDRLAETLLAWLQAGRNANEVAVRLHVHPQTVRYRLRQLDDLFGDRLQDPDLRFELEIVLRARALVSAGRG